MKALIFALGLVASACALEHVCLSTLQCIINPLELSKRLEEINVDDLYTTAKKCLGEAGCEVPDAALNRSRRAIDEPLARFRRGLTEIEGIDKACAIEFMKEMAKDVDKCLHGGERSITSNDKIINLYMALRMCNKGKIRKAGLCIVKELEIDVNDVKENAGNVQPCPCIAEMPDDCKQQISTNTKKVCDCVTQFVTQENLAAFEAQCGELNDAQRAKANEMMDKMTNKCANPVSHIVDDVKERCPELTDFALPDPE
jgi:hypothetical protein